MVRRFVLSAKEIRQQYGIAWVVGRPPLLRRRRHRRHSHLRQWCAQVFCVEEEVGVGWSNSRVIGREQDELRSTRGFRAVWHGERRGGRFWPVRGGNEPLGKYGGHRRHRDRGHGRGRGQGRQEGWSRLWRFAQLKRLSAAAQDLSHW